MESGAMGNWSEFQPRLASIDPFAILIQHPIRHHDIRSSHVEHRITQFSRCPPHHMPVAGKLNCAIIASARFYPEGEWAGGTP
jgi:hypothetical protein